VRCESVSAIRHCSGTSLGECKEASWPRAQFITLLTQRAAPPGYFWRRFRTPLGVSFLLAFPIMAAMLWYMYSLAGANWVIGAFGLLFFMNLIMESSYYVFLPNAFARRLSDPTMRTSEVETSSKGVRVVTGPNATLLTWQRYRHVWLYDDFVLLAMKPPFMLFTYIPTAGMTPEVRRDIQGASEGKPIA
jgi:hypothetical protein